MPTRRALPSLALLSICMLSAPAVAEPNGYAPRARLTGGALLSASFAGLGGSADLNLLGTPLSASPQTTERLAGGGYIALALTPKWGLQVELLYSTRGANSGETLGGFGDAAGAFTLDYDLRYLELPILATFTVPYDGAVTQYFFAGPDLAYLLAADIDGDGYVTDPDSAALEEFAGSEDISADTSSFDLGLTIGAGVKLPLASGRLLLAVRYTMSLTESVSSNEITISQGIVLTSQKLRHRALSLSAGYEF